jgi:amino acid transporter
MSPATFLPSFDLDSLSYISVIVFNCLGFEIVCTFSGDMENPRTQIPQAIIIGGLVIAAIYLFSGFGIGAAIPTHEISTDSGLVDAVALISGKTGGLFIGTIALLFLLTLFGNMTSWSMGVNATAAYAADRGDMPRPFQKRWGKNGMPIGAALINGIVATVVCLLGVVMDALFPNSSLFWTFFGLNLVMFLLSYLPIFPAFLTLRKTDGERERPFSVPGSPVVIRILALVPMALIVLALIFTAVPLAWDRDALEAVLPITIGSALCIAIGEILIEARRKKSITH